MSDPVSVLEPPEQFEADSDDDAQHRRIERSAAHRVDDGEQKEADTDRDVPPAPVLRLKSAHLSTVSCPLRNNRPGEPSPPL